MKILELVDSSGLREDVAALRARFHADGYLFMRGALSPEPLQDLLKRIVSISRASGWLNESSRSDDRCVAIGQSCEDPDPRFRAVYDKVFGLRSLHAIGHCSELMSLARSVLDTEEVFVHPKKLPRLVFPRVANTVDTTTPSHQDFVGVQGSTKAITIWFPLHDCELEEGPLMIAPGTHRHGVLDFRLACGPGSTAVVGDDDFEWRSADFRTGDAVVFSTMTVHRASENRSSRMRVSVDCRYQNTREPICQAALSVNDWDRVYTGWETQDPLRHYWERFDLHVVAFDFSYRAPRDRMALEEGAKGNTAAISALQRLVCYAPEESTRDLAQHYLDQLLRSVEAGE